MIQLVQGSTVVLDAKRSLRDAAVAFDEQEIISVGPFGELRGRWPEARLLGGPTKLVMPGLVNAHDHGRGLTTWDRGLVDGGLETWRLEQMGVAQPGWYWQALQYGLAMLRTGVTTLVHMHPAWARPGTLLPSCAEALRAYREIGIRVCFVISAWDQQRLVYAPDEEFLAALPAELATTVRGQLGTPASLDEIAGVGRELASEAKGSRACVYLGPMGPQWCSEELLKGLKKAADALDTGLHSHLLETIYQKMWAERALGRSIVEVMDEWGLVDERLTCAHSVWLSDADIDLLARRGAKVSHNPSSNLRLRSGIARVPAMLAHGLTVGIGLDGMGFRQQDLFAEMRLALALGRAPGLDTPALDSASVWRLATEGGALAALGRQDLGTLEPGNQADLVVLDELALRAPYPAAQHEPVDLLVWRGRPELVETVVVGGELLVEDGRPLRVNPDGVARQLDAELAALERPTASGGWQQELAEHARRFYASWGPIPVTGWGSSTR